MSSQIFGEAKPPDPQQRTRMALIVGVAVLIVGVVFALFALWPRIAPGEKPSAFKEGYSEFNNVIRAGNPDYAIYLKHLFIVNARGMVSENMLGQKVALVSGILRNDGAQSLDVVEVKVTLTDLEGKPLRTYLRTPVKPDRPVLPSESREFKVSLTPYPPEWTMSPVQTEIYGFRYKH